MDLLFQPEPVIWVQQTLGEGWAGLFRLLSTAGTSTGFVLAFGLCLWLFGRRALYGLVILAGVEAVLRQVVSSGLGVDRPSADAIIKYETVEGSASFPSGHMTSAAAVWAYLGLATPFPLALAALLLLAVAVGRIYLGVHYVVDVVGGIILGVLLAWAWMPTAPRLLDRIPDWGFRVWGGLAAVALAGLMAVALSMLGESHLQWNGAGLVAGLLLALPLEARWVGYRPSSSGTDRLRCAVAGSVGVVLLVGARLAMPPEALVAGAGVLAAAVLWALLVAPVLFVRWGWSGRGTGGSVP